MDIKEYMELKRCPSCRSIHLLHEENFGVRCVACGWEKRFTKPKIEADPEISGDNLTERVK